MADWSETYTFLDGQWIEGNTPFIGARTHAFWLGSSVFDGARAFEGVAPDLERHLARVNRSAKTMWLNPIKSVEEDTVPLFKSHNWLLVPSEATTSSWPSPLMSAVPLMVQPVGTVKPLFSITTSPILPTT